MYFKILNEEECHHGFQYKNGLNIDKRPFISDASEDCAPGGLYFSDEKNILEFLSYGPFIREVRIPKDAQIVHFEEKSRADKLELLERRDLRKVSTWEWLIENGVDIHFNNEQPLRDAVLYGRTEVVKILLKYGADVNACNGEPLRTAACYGQTEIAKILLKYGADPNVCDGLPLRYAAYHGETEIAKILLKKGADINACNGEPLRNAARKGHTEIVKILLKYGADPKLKDCCDRTALDIVKEKNHTQIVKLLEKA